MGFILASGKIQWLPISSDKYDLPKVTVYSGCRELFVGQGSVGQGSVGQGSLGRPIVVAAHSCDAACPSVRCGSDSLGLRTTWPSPAPAHTHTHRQTYTTDYYTRSVSVQHGHHLRLHKHTHTPTDVHDRLLGLHCALGPTHTRSTALFPGLPGWTGTRKVKPIWILLKQETVSK